MINLELENIYYQDKEDRQNYDNNSLTKKELYKNDKIRLKRVKQMIKNKEIDFEEIWNCHYAALIFHHSHIKKDYITAHKLTTKAVNMGSKVTLWLHKATYDRVLLSLNNPQKYNTQTIYK